MHTDLESCLDVELWFSERILRADRYPGRIQNRKKRAVRRTRKVAAADRGKSSLEVCFSFYFYAIAHMQTVSVLAWYLCWNGARLWLSSHAVQKPWNPIKTVTRDNC